MDSADGNAPLGGRAVAMLTDEQAAAVATYYPRLTPALVREVVAAPPSAGLCHRPT